MLYIIIFAVLYGLIPFLLVGYIDGREKIKPIIPFTLVVFLASLYEFFGSILFQINVEQWFLIYSLLAFFAIHYFFYKILNKKFAHLFKILILFYLIFYFASRFGLRSLNYLDISSYLNVYQTIIVLLFSVLWFRKIFQEFQIEKLLDSPTFYFISGLLIYYCGSVAIFLMANDLYAKDKNSLQYFWLVNIILNFVLRTLLIVGIWKARSE